MSLTNGSTIDLSTINTDTQDLTAATLNGTVLDISIENGSSVSVDLSGLLVGLQNQLDDLEARVEELEACACDSVGLEDEATEIGILYHNIPNPFNNTSVIKYYIPTWASSANLVISDDIGKIILNEELFEKGAYGKLHVNAEGLSTGVYQYTLYINQTVIDTKKMLVQ